MKSRNLPEFDRYKYYRRAVQAPDVDCDFVSDTYKQLRGRRPKVLREDFCGTFAICCEWVKANKKNRALGIDLDPEPLAYGREHYLSELNPEQKKRVKIIEGSVLTAKPSKVDVIAALNFSYYLFKSRLLLRQYFARARQGLKSNGLMVVDCFGGGACMQPNEEKTKIAGFHYFWEQASYNAVSNEAMFYIHFKRKGEKKRERVFEYDWRMWTIPEIREAMAEAGFRKTHVYWEGSTRSGQGNGIFSRSEKAEDFDAWVAYIVAEV